MKLKKKIIIGSSIFIGIIVLAILFPNLETTIVNEVAIKAPVSEVYAVLAEIDNVDEWAGAVHKAEYISDVRYGAGAARQCTLADGSIVQEKVTDAIDNQWIAMEMTRHELPVDFFKWKIETVDKDGGTTVRQTTNYQVKLGLIGAILNQVAIKNSLSQTMDGIYQGLKSYVEENLNTEKMNSNNTSHNTNATTAEKYFKAFHAGRIPEVMSYFSKSAIVTYGTDPDKAANDFFNETKELIATISFETHGIYASEGSDNVLIHFSYQAPSDEKPIEAVDIISFNSSGQITSVKVIPNT
ncbi:MAG: SRPBCC family protein [Cyclobacteriaceae bacterium]